MRTAPVRRPIGTIGDFRSAASRTLPPDVRAYVAGGAGDETTLRRNTRALRALQLRTSALAGLAAANASVDLLGQRLSMPVLLAPVGLQHLLHPEAELASAQGAARAGTVFIVSTAASLALETVARPGAGHLWFQLYAQPDWGCTVDLIRRAETSGYRAIVVTVDAHRFGPRDWQQRHGFDWRAFEYPNVAPARFEIAPLAWDDVERIRSATVLPLILKGILTAEDAVRACESGVDALVVSNHGGRVLDALPATADVLPSIADAVGHRLPLLADGGVRRGTDVLKMLALGATAVLIGRPYVYALHVDGAAGVAAVLGLLHDELTTAMALCGRPTTAAIDGTVLWPPRGPRPRLEQVHTT